MKRYAVSYWNNYGADFYLVTAKNEKEMEKICEEKHIEVDEFIEIDIKKKFIELGGSHE